MGRSVIDPPCPKEEISAVRRWRGEKFVSNFLRGGGMDVFWNDPITLLPIDRDATSATSSATLSLSWSRKKYTPASAATIMDRPHLNVE
jgi:hypothetical protein